MASDASSRTPLTTLLASALRSRRTSLYRLCALAISSFRRCTSNSIDVELRCFSRHFAIARRMYWHPQSLFSIPFGIGIKATVSSSAFLVGNAKHLVDEEVRFVVVFHLANAVVHSFPEVGSELKGEFTDFLFDVQD